MQLKTINIKGKEYVTVPERVRYFNETYPRGSIVCEISYHENYVRCKAKVTPDIESPDRFFVGHAEEDRKQGMVNATSATENAETSAVGRALGFMSIGAIETIASAEEVVSAIHKQQSGSSTKRSLYPYKAPPQAGAPTETKPASS